MPFPYIQSLLGASFALMWVFIGAMILQDRLQEVRDERSETPEEPSPYLPPEPAFIRRSRRLRRIRPARSRQRTASQPV